MSSDSFIHLLSQPNSFIQDEDETLSSLNTTFENCIGELNLSQFLHAMLVSLSWFFDGQQTFITIFTDSQPSWHCTQVSEFSYYSCNTTTNMCNLPKDSWAWNEPTQTSMISEFGLQCENSFITGLPASMFFTGCLIGGLVLATLADSSSLGRKYMLFFACLLMSLSALFASSANNVWIYSAFKFISGFGRATIGTSALVLVSEMVGKRWRALISTTGFYLYTAGFLTLPLLAYINRGFSWRNLYLWTSIPAILYCVTVYFFVLESPRWLLIRGKKEEAVKILKKITSLTHSNLDLAISRLSSFDAEMIQDTNVDLFSAFKIMLRKRWSSRRLMAITAMGLGIGLVYYGMPLGLEILSYNIYLSVTFNALSEIPSALLVCILIEKFNRRSVIFLLTIISGISSILAIMEGKIFTRMQIVFELISFFTACTAYGILLIYSSELFPTCVRNSALSLPRQAGMLGGVFSPLLVAASRGHRFLCFGVFGLGIGCSGMFGILLPETRDLAVSDTMDEEETKHKQSGI